MEARLEGCLLVHLCRGDKDVVHSIVWSGGGGEGVIAVVCFIVEGMDSWGGTVDQKV